MRESGLFVWLCWSLAACADIMPIFFLLLLLIFFKWALDKAARSEGLSSGRSFLASGPSSSALVRSR